MDFVTIKTWAKKIGAKDPFSAKINDLSDEKWLEHILDPWIQKNFKTYPYQDGTRPYTRQHQSRASGQGR